MMPELGHVVFCVRSLTESLRFYRDAVGLQEKGRILNGRAALLSGGRTHHELLIIEVGDAPGPPRGKRIGLYHVGWKVGDSLEELGAVMARLRAQGVPVKGMADHTISQSLYLLDPDVNEIQLYVDNPAIDWSRDGAWMEAPVRPLELRETSS